ncbi:MAG: hypothetical protein J5577_01440 [Bacteroidales bacterium]|nr:hypothetical protein [Bacteroidales bacterium]MBR4817426.1 hypothetical protein [Bacteroidales bacterium]
MRKLSIAALIAVLLAPSVSRAQGLKEVEGSFLEPLQQRDSILVADQLRYGFTLEDVAEGTQLRMQDYSKAFGDTLIVVRNWQVDTLKTIRESRKGPVRYNLRGDVVLAPFEAGTYHLPQIAIQRISAAGVVDTLVFDPQVMEVKTMPVDTTTFVPHDIKGQMRYPLTFMEVLPYLIGLLLLAGLVVLTVLLIRRRKETQGVGSHRDPAYIVALRKLDAFRGDKYWAPDKQKTYYSGITDTLREYIAETFGIDAKEMTTAEIFDALKGDGRLTEELYGSTKELFELADFVKFAKHVADDSENAAALPLSVRFVTSTYQSVLEEETPQAGNEKEAE